MSFQRKPLCIDLSPASTRSRRSHSDDDIVDTHQKDSGSTMSIQCLSELTPLDMMDMSFGIADPTGSCVWLGAWLFMEMFSRDLVTTHAAEMQKYWSRIRRTLFPPNCHALELGAGTGMAGLSLMVMRRNSQINGIISGPSILVQTDKNDHSLALCQINRNANKIASDGEGCVCVGKLEWGKGNTTEIIGSGEEETGPLQQTIPTSFDVVFATDVLYDLASLVPLVTTAEEKLKEGGYFILSHTPRASIDDNDERYNSDTTDYWQQLEAIIVQEASKVNLVLAKYPPRHEDMSDPSEKIAATNENTEHNHLNGSMILQPSLLPNIWTESSSLSKKYSWQNMTDVGAAVFVFQKQGL